MNMVDLSAKIKAAAQERKEKELCKKYDLTLEGSNGTQTGQTSTGKKVIFSQCYGFSEQSKYGVGTLQVMENGEWKTIFTKGYPSKALKWMTNN